MMIILYWEHPYEPRGYKYEIWEPRRGDYVSDPCNFIASYWIVPGTIDPMED